MQDTLLARILSMYGLADAQVLACQGGYRNRVYPVLLKSGQRRGLIVYKPGTALQAIESAHYVAEHLVRQGLPVRSLANPRVLQLRSGDKSTYAALYTYLPGTTIPWEAYTMEHIKALGGSLGGMHRLLRPLPRSVGAWVADEYLARCGRMQRYLSDPEVQAAMQRKLGFTLDPRHCERFRRLLTLSKGLPGQQWLHMDFVRGNILFEGAHISGIIDFEKTGWGHPLLDIARTLAFLLVDCKYKTQAQVRTYFLQSGYTKRGGNQCTNIRLRTNQGIINVLETFVSLFLYYDMYKFLCHNPYEYLYQNEHFTRTRALLAERSLLTSIE